MIGWSWAAAELPHEPEMRRVEFQVVFGRVLSGFGYATAQGRYAVDFRYIN